MHAFGVACSIIKLSSLSLLTRTPGASHRLSVGLSAMLCVTASILPLYPNFPFCGVTFPSSICSISDLGCPGKRRAMTVKADKLSFAVGTLRAKYLSSKHAWACPGFGSVSDGIIDNGQDIFALLGICYSRMCSEDFPFIVWGLGLDLCSPCLFLCPQSRCVCPLAGRNFFRWGKFSEEFLDGGEVSELCEIVCKRDSQACSMISCAGVSAFGRCAGIGVRRGALWRCWMSLC